MFKWKKLGRILDPESSKSYDWIEEFAQAPSMIVEHDLLRVFFCSRAKPDASGQYVSRLGYADLDPSDLTKVVKISARPVLPLGKIGEFDEFGTYPVSVIKSGDELWAYYAGWTRCESVPFNAAIGLAKSQNMGVYFEKYGSGPVLGYSPDEPFVLGSPKIRFFDGKWYLWYSAGKKWVGDSTSRPEPVYKIRMASSTDGVNWEKQGKDIIESVLEENECQASPDVFFHNGQFHMFFSYRFNLSFKAEYRGYRLGYAKSPDLLNWEREDTAAGLKVSNSGWDSNDISYPNIFSLNDQIYMLYQGNGIGRAGFGLAQLEDFS